MLRGERFEVDLGGDEKGGDASHQTEVLPGASVNDVLERKPAIPKSPTAPTLKSSTGFPGHGAKRAESRFKQGLSVKRPATASTSPLRQRPSQNEDAPSSDERSGGEPRTWEDNEKAQIDRENNARLADMSPAEIERERSELMSSLSPVMIQKLLQRSSLESGSAETDLSRHREPLPGSSMKHVSARRPSETGKEKRVAFAELEDPPSPDLDSDEEDGNGQHAVVAPNLPMEPLPPDDSIHFPRPPQPPELDPSSDTFLNDLHDKYFPSLPADPEKLEWMQQPSTVTQKGTASTPRNTYDPSASGLEPKDIRFDFKGRLIPPSTAAEIPVTAGLHHHGDAPEAAGYTIPELSHLARSSYAPQRCIVFQTLGRILYRLGRGEYGDASEASDVVGAEESLGALARGLWRVLGEEKVTEMLVRESEGKGVDGGRHLSAKAYATEAVWLWQRGGGRRLEAE